MQLGQKGASTKSLPPEHKPLAQARGFLAFPLIVFSYPRSVIPVQLSPFFIPAAIPENALPANAHEDGRLTARLPDQHSTPCGILARFCADGQFPLPPDDIARLAPPRQPEPPSARRNAFWE